MEMEERRRDVRRAEQIRQMKRRRLSRRRLLLRCVIGIVAFSFGFGAGWAARGRRVRKPVDLSSIEPPNWVEQQLLTENPNSRPGTKLAVVNNIVIHYVANPMTTAQNNRDYFEGLKNQSGSSPEQRSSHFIVGLDGEVIQCIPVDEKAFASNDRNWDTVAIECCHRTEDGSFTEETYDSLVRHTAWLSKELHLTSEDLIRHYDVTGKNCPKYFVDHEDAWEKFKKDVKKAMR